MLSSCFCAFSPPTLSSLFYCQVFKSDFSLVKLCDFGSVKNCQDIVIKKNELLPYCPAELVAKHANEYYQVGWQDGQGHGHDDGGGFNYDDENGDDYYKDGDDNGQVFVRVKIM